jgi:hypothetical protein
LYKLNIGLVQNRDKHLIEMNGLHERPDKIIRIQICIKQSYH